MRLSAARSETLRGPAGEIEAHFHSPERETPRFSGVVSHPHPLYGGSMDNPVVVETCQALVDAGGDALRFNFRGVGRSAGAHDRGRGERDDLHAVIEQVHARSRLPLLVAGYSFGAVVTLDLLSAEPSPMPAVGAVLLLAPPVARYPSSSWSLGAAPAVVIFGEDDELTPEAELRRAAGRWGEKLHIVAIPRAGHDLGTSSGPRPLRRALESALSSLRTSAAR